eukprot:TRINITY_DN15463_c0_g1_i1.p1 TRINITY_DN15463_c0_g1~~TRINITY_DN15463_c0_g1_i1.p1  ORF type:complete len:340 (-),score=47.42 TRINITY_DN15463_c0_g1_i1:64-1083(-)
MEHITTVFLVRHGDRFDYANTDTWASSVRSLNIEARDPPLSAIGHAQARILASVLGSGSHDTDVSSPPPFKIDAILASPYLRTIQTAQPLAHATGLSICVEEGLAELGHVPGTIPPPAERYRYFPEIDLSYQPVHEPIIAVAPDSVSAAAGAAAAAEASVAAGSAGSGVSASTPGVAEVFPDAYLRRMSRMGDLLLRRFRGRCIACVSHAASLAMVAAVVKVPLSDVGRFAPCGVFALQHDGRAWRMATSGADNSVAAYRALLDSFGAPIRSPALAVDAGAIACPFVVPSGRAGTPAWAFEDMRRMPIRDIEKAWQGVLGATESVVAEDSPPPAEGHAS